jgi:hypothetical protein
MKIYNMTDSWTNGSNYNAIKMNVTDTSSGDSSKLINLLIDGNEKFSVRKDGLLDAKRVMVSGQLSFGVTTISGVAIPENCPPVIIYDPSGVAVVTDCSTLEDSISCGVVDGCTWIAAHDCADNVSQGPCDGAYGCTWTNYYCEDFGDEVGCTAINGCGWSATASPCSEFNNNQAGCEAEPTCTWDDPNCTGSYDIYGCEGGEIEATCSGGVTTDYTDVTLELGTPENPTTYFIHNSHDDYVCLSKDAMDNLIFIASNAAAMVTHIGNGQWLKI